MNNKNSTLEELLSTFSSGISTEEMLFAHYASDIAVAITSKRVELGLTQKEFAEKLGKSQAIISRWENADCNFQLRTLIEIAQKLNLTLNLSLKNSLEKSNSQKVIQFPVRYIGESSASPVWTQRFSEDDELQEM